MWSQVQKILHPTAQLNGSNGVTPPVIPLRKSLTAIDGLDVGKAIVFSKKSPLAPLSGTTTNIIALRYYRFGTDTIKSYQLQLGQKTHYFLTIAQDEQGQYLGISRALDAQEQDVWFGRDALSFFTEKSTVKSIRCKADLMIEGEWAAARYSKIVDWADGTVSTSKSNRQARAFHYNLLVNETGDKALEIEHDLISGENRIYVTIYRPIEDIASIEDAKHSEIQIDEEPLFKEPMLTASIPKQRQDFRRIEDTIAQPIHIERTPLSLADNDNAHTHLPSFLMGQEAEEDYLSLDDIIPPESERVRVSVRAAQSLITHAIRKNVRVRDVLRDMLGLESALSEEVVFEMPLTEEDYRTLAMRYKLRPDHRVEIRSRLEEELRHKLTGLA